MKRILIADNDDVITTVLAEFLKFRGYEVFTANRGDRAFYMLEESKPDLIIADTYIQGLNSEILVERLRSNVSFADLPVIILSDTFLQQNNDLLKADKRVKLLKKPINLHHLETLCKYSLKGSRP